MNKYSVDWAIGSSNLKNKDKSILQFLFKCSDDTGKCFPCVTTITKQTSMSESSYKYAIKNLIAMGLVKREFRYSRITGQQRSNYFYLAKEFFTLSKDNITLFINNAVKAFNRKKQELKEKELQFVASVPPSETEQQNNAVKKEILSKLTAIATDLNKSFRTKVQALKLNFSCHNDTYNNNCSLKSPLNTYNFVGRGQQVTTYTPTLFSRKRKNINTYKDVIEIIKGLISSVTG